MDDNVIKRLLEPKYHEINNEVIRLTEQLNILIQERDKLKVHLELEGINFNNQIKELKKDTTEIVKPIEQNNIVTTNEVYTKPVKKKKVSISNRTVPKKKIVEKLNWHKFIVNSDREYSKLTSVLAKFNLHNKIKATDFIKHLVDIGYLSKASHGRYFPSDNMLDYCGIKDNKTFTLLYYHDKFMELIFNSGFDQRNGNI